MPRATRPNGNTHGEPQRKSTWVGVLAALRHVSLATLAMSVLGCGSAHSTLLIGDTKDASPGTGGAPAKGAGGGASREPDGDTGAGGDPGVCHASNLSSAPLPCSQDFTHAKAKYGAQCTTDGGYQAHCDPYDAVVYHSATESVWCYYDAGTGNLIGARETPDPAGAGGTCVAFDTSFTEPSTASCAPASGGSCPSP
jgi:hypothetical protein